MKFIKIKETKLSGDISINLIRIDNIEKIEFFEDNYFSTPQYYIYLNNVSISGNSYLTKNEYDLIKERILKAIGEENIYE